MSMNIWDIYNKSGSNKTKKNVQALNFKEFDACLNDLVLAALKEFLDLLSSCLSFCSSTSVRCSKAAFFIFVLIELYVAVVEETVHIVTII